MRALYAALLMACLLCAAGCGPSPSAGTKTQPAAAPQPSAGFAPARVLITPWTEIRGQGEVKRQIRAFVRLVDAFSCDIKAPGVLRFELYEKLPRSAELRGRRLMIWPDFDLTTAEQNNAFWKDFVRAYEFALDFEPPDAGTYVLEATFIPPQGRRLTAQYQLNGPAR
jgi:hypothetical protein